MISTQQNRLVEIPNWQSSTAPSLKATAMKQPCDAQKQADRQSKIRYATVLTAAMNQFGQFWRIFCLIYDWGTYSVCRFGVLTGADELPAERRTRGGPSQPTDATATGKLRGGHGGLNGARQASAAPPLAVKNDPQRGPNGNTGWYVGPTGKGPRPKAQNCSAFLDLGRNRKNPIARDWTVGDPNF